MPRRAPPRACRLRPETLATERIWWGEYLADKTIVVGSGPSVHSPLGSYIDLFGEVLRLNDFAIGVPDASGMRVTSAFVSPATKARVDGISIAKLVPNASRVHVALFGSNVSAAQALMLDPHYGAKRHPPWAVPRSEGIGPSCTTHHPCAMAACAGSGLLLGKQATPLPDMYDVGLNGEMMIAEGKHATMGALATSWALHNLPTRPIFLVGLDLISGSIPPDEDLVDYVHADGSHTNPENIRQYHDVPAEWRWMQKQLADGSVRLLDQTLGEVSIPSPPPPPLPPPNEIWSQQRRPARRGSRSTGKSRRHHAIQMHLLVG